MNTAASLWGGALGLGAGSVITYFLAKDWGKRETANWWLAYSASRFSRDADPLKFWFQIVSGGFLAAVMFALGVCGFLMAFTK